MRSRSAVRTRVPLVAMLSADAISMAGNAAALVAIPWYVLQTTGSPSKTGITAAAAIVPVIISGVVGGAYVDRLGYRRASIVADLASFAAVAAIPLLHATVGLAFWQLVLLVFLGALLDAPGVTARASMLPDIAAPAGWSLERVSGAAAAVNRASRLAGAPVAGLLIAFVGPTNVLWIDAATFVFSAAAIWLG
ncbi:MAG: MFS transporter, partial [Chloroflexota bacterium]|nr:MFS transporter [Chloroflexota bacterium]